MKTKFTLIGAAIICLTVCMKAQIPNSNMENWTIAINLSDSLIGWSSNNVFNYLMHKPVFKEFIGGCLGPGPYDGNFALGIKTNPDMGSQNAAVGLIVNGKASIVSIPTIGMFADIPGVFGGGTPLSYKPTHLEGYYNYTSDFADQGLAIILLSKYNVSLHKRDTVGFGMYHFAINTNYANFSIPITDKLPSVLPDSITTIFYSSDPTLLQPFSGYSRLFLDSLYLSPKGPTGIEDKQQATLMINIYPNPNNGIFTINIANEKKKQEQIEIIDSQGKKVKDVFLNPAEKNVEVDMSDYADGLYFLKPSSTKSFSKKIILQK